MVMKTKRISLLYVFVRHIGLDRAQKKKKQLVTPNKRINPMETIWLQNP